MNIRKDTLATSIRLALSFGLIASSAYGAEAFAQDGQAPDSTTSKTLETVTVTGSLIRRVDVETASPVVTIDRAQIQATGKLTLGDLVQQLPAMTGSNLNPQVNNGGGTGVSSINLRGLGARRTLILIDGQRLLSADPNAIPADAIERIEVLPSGASATYGSDAIGGVVNFILRRNYQGATFTANVGQSDRNDGDQSGYTFTFGQTSDKGSLMAGINYSRQMGVLQGDRDFSKNALSLVGDRVLVGGSSSTPVGRIQLPEDLANAFGCEFVSLNKGGNSQVVNHANYHCYTSADKYNYAAVNLLMTPQERAGAFISGDFRLTDHVTAYLDAVYERTSSSSQLAPTVYGTDSTGADIAGGNAFNPTGQPYNSVSGLSLRSRLTSVGNRAVSNGREDAQINTGLKGDFALRDRPWHWDVGFNYGHQQSTKTVTGLVSESMLYTGSSVLNPDGTASCPNDISPVACQFNPFDVYAPGTVAAAKAALASAPSNTHIAEKTWHAGINGDLFALPAGTVQLAVGAEYRQDSKRVTPDTEILLDPATANCVLGSQCVAALAGGYNTKDLYAEAFVPVLADMLGVRSLNLTVGDRYSRVSTFGSTNNMKFAVEYKPIDDLLLRGTMEEVFRAPNIDELYQSGSDSPSLKSDPCTHFTGAPSGSSLALACPFVPTNGTFENSGVTTQTQISTITEGAALSGFPIRPEHGKSFDLGLVYSPAFAPGLSTTLDFWHIYLDDLITQVGAQSVLNLCAAGQTAFCPYIKRIESGPNAGQVGQGFVEPTANLGSLRTGGIDGSANYKLPALAIGQVNIGVSATYLNYYIQETAPGTAGNVTYSDAGHWLPAGSAQAAACPDNLGGCLFPRWRAQGFVNWQAGGWNAEWRLRYISRFQNGGPAGSLDDTAPNEVSGTILKYGATVYNDVSVGYHLAPINTRLDFGVNNVFDKQPPLLYANNSLNANTDPANFDLMGRYFWARVTVKF